MGLPLYTHNVFPPTNIYILFLTYQATLATFLALFFYPHHKSVSSSVVYCVLLIHPYSIPMTLPHLSCWQGPIHKNLSALGCHYTPWCIKATAIQLFCNYTPADNIIPVALNQSCCTRNLNSCNRSCAVGKKHPAP